MKYLLGPGGVVVRVLDSWSWGRGFDSWLLQYQVNLRLWASYSHPRASVTKQYNLVPARWPWCCLAGKVTAGLAESNGSLPPGVWAMAMSPVGWLCLWPGSAPDSRLVYEYQLPLPLPYLLSAIMLLFLCFFFAKLVVIVVAAAAAADGDDILMLLSGNSETSEVVICSITHFRNRIPSCNYHVREPGFNFYLS